MLKKSILLIILFLLCFVALIQGQNIDFNSKNFSDKAGLAEALKNMKKGDEYFGYKKAWIYPNALEYYLKAQEFNPNNAVLNFKIGICYLNSCNKAASLGYFLKAKELNPKVDPKINYAIAQAYHYSLKFDEAIATYTEYLEKNLSESDRAVLSPQIQKKILECKQGKKLVESAVNVKIENLGASLNSIYNDYTPLSTKPDSFIIFTSRREEAPGKQVAMNTKDFFEDIYISRMNGGVWSKPVQLSSNISGSSHDAASALIYSGFSLLIYKGLSGAGDIYESNLSENGTWSVPKPIAAMNSPHHESSAYITEDGQTAFVVSNNPDKSLGGHDIFSMKMREDGSWSHPVNIGLNVNTPYDEEGVFASADGNTLYFSSKGHNSMGGYDVFRSRFENGEWSAPENLGYPLNTPDDDLYLIAFGSPGSEEGYYTSVRPEGNGLMDIYYYKFTPVLADTRSQLTDSVTSDTTYTVDLYKGEPSDAFVSLTDQDKASQNTNKTTTEESNTTVKSTATQEQNNQDTQADKGNQSDSDQKTTTASNDTGKEKKEGSSQTGINIPAQSGVVFHVQVGASRKPMPERELRARYPGAMYVTRIEHEGWYKYLIGKYEKYSEAKTLQRTCGTPDAWVVVYKNGTRVHIREVSDMLSYYTNSAMLYALLRI
jgi:tetratricopeptide (TPR) repeat protein